MKPFPVSYKHSQMHLTNHHLSQNLIRKNINCLDGLGRNHSVASTRLSGASLQTHLLSLVLTLDGLVLLHTVQVLHSALGRSHMLHLHMDSLLDDTVSHLLVHLHTHSSLGHIKHHSSASVITLEGHTLMDGAIGLNIDVVSILVATHVSRERNHSMITEVSLEHVTSTCTISVSVRHDLQDNEYKNKIQITNLSQ